MRSKKEKKSPSSFLFPPEFDLFWWLMFFWRGKKHTHSGQMFSYPFSQHSTMDAKVKWTENKKKIWIFIDKEKRRRRWSSLWWWKNKMKTNAQIKCISCESSEWKMFSLSFSLSLWISAYWFMIRLSVFHDHHFMDKTDCCCPFVVVFFHHIAIRSRLHEFNVFVVFNG
mgnify:CR=1 FL=1